MNLYFRLFEKVETDVIPVASRPEICRLYQPLIIVVTDQYKALMKL